MYSATNLNHEIARYASTLLSVLLILNLTACSTLRPEKVAAPAVVNPQTYLAGVCVEMTQCWPTNHTINIVCHGHSVPAGYGRTPEVRMLDAYPDLLHRALCERYPHAVINVIVTGIGGENSEQGAERFARDVLSLRPEVVTVDYALNDRSIGLNRSATAWRKMIETALAHHVRVILVTPTPDLRANLTDPNDPLNQQAGQIRQLAAEYHVGLVDSQKLFEEKIRTGTALKNLMAQSNHPNRAGHEIVAASLLQWFPTPNAP